MHENYQEFTARERRREEEKKIIRISFGGPKLLIRTKVTIHICTFFFLFSFHSVHTQKPNFLYIYVCVCSILKGKPIDCKEINKGYQS